MVVIHLLKKDSRKGFFTKSDDSVRRHIFTIFIINDRNIHKEKHRDWESISIVSGWYVFQAPLRSLGGPWTILVGMMQALVFVVADREYHFR